MSIKKAELSDLNIVKSISTITISEVYPHYYPKGAVEFFLQHHSENNVSNDISLNQVFLCVDTEQHIVGTVTIKGNQICRLFVLPTYQRNGYGKEMLDYAENVIFAKYAEIKLDVSLPAKKLYEKRGYRETEFVVIKANDDDFLCYDVMAKQGQIVKEL